MNNYKVRKALFQYDMKYGELAKLLGMTDTSLSRKLSKELSWREQRELVKIIKEVSENGNDNS